MLIKYTDFATYNNNKMAGKSTPISKALALW